MKPEISIILPCRNEEEALPFCLKQIKQVIKKNKLSAEIIVSDSSTDKSPEIAKRENVVLVKHNKDGYGNAYLEGFKKAQGDYIFMADADGTYNFKEIPHFIKQIKDGFDMAIGDRFAGKMEKNAMTFSHKYIGNPILSLLLKLFFGGDIRDPQCGMRAFKTSLLEKLNLQTTGFEFISEITIRSIGLNLKIKQIPINYYNRSGKSKLRSFSDAWRNIRFMLLYSPLFLFLIPGIILFLMGALSMFWFYFGSPNIFGIKLIYYPMFLSSFLTIVGYQLIFFSAFAKIYLMNHLKEKDPFLEKTFEYITIERASIMGAILLLLGMLFWSLIIIKWINSGFGELHEIKISVVALTFAIIGIQTIFSSFMLSMLSIRGK